MRTLELPFRTKKQILACGADLKGAFCLLRKDKAYASGSFGDLSDMDNMRRYERAIKKALRDIGAEPQIVACDMHPGYFSTKFAEKYVSRRPISSPRLRCPRLVRDLGGLPSAGIRYVQHHHAHIVSCMLDNGIEGEVIGVSFDGTGFGTDGNIWGGEFLLSDFNKFRRLGRLDYVAMPGGERAITEPWRMALSYLHKAYGKDLFSVKIPFLGEIDIKKSKVLIHMIKTNLNSPLTSSGGRFFDGISALLGIRHKIRYEAEAAIELEKSADAACRHRYGYNTIQAGGMFIIKVEDIVRNVVKDLIKKEKSAVISSKFHNTIACVIAETARRISEKTGARTIVFSGGVFQNRFLVARLRELLKNSGYRTYFHDSFPATDAGIALGQAAVAASGG